MERRGESRERRGDERRVEAISTNHLLISLAEYFLVTTGAIMS